MKRSTKQVASSRPNFARMLIVSTRRHAALLGQREERGANPTRFSHSNADDPAFDGIDALR
jgi:hypothetical protein